MYVMDEKILTTAPIPLTKKDYTSSVDGFNDWYLRSDAGEGHDCLVVLHGHRAHGDQLLTTPSIFSRLQFIAERKLSVISPNLRDNAWMNPAAVTDLADILTREKQIMKYRRCIFVCGSMGGTSALIFAIRHPEMVDGLAILGGASSIRRYRNWCSKGDLEIHDEIRQAIDAGYDEKAFELNDVCAHADKLTMPLRFYHGVGDLVIPIEEMRALKEKLKDQPNAKFVELPKLDEAPEWWDDHNTPIPYFSDLLAELLDICNSQ